MSVVLERSELESSPLADLHVIANEVGVDGFRRMRKADLVDAIVTKQGGGERKSSSTRARSRTKKTTEGTARTSTAAAAPDSAADKDGDDGAARSRTRSRRTRARGNGEQRSGERTSGRDSDRSASRANKTPDRVNDTPVEGVVELLSNGSAFLRLKEAESGPDDVYISATQVKRCELVSGDRVSGPTRPPRRSERFPALVRVDMINGKKADEVVEGGRFEDLPAAFPTERFTLQSDDTTVKAIEWLTPFGKGSRVTIVGPSRAGKSEAMRKLAAALSRHEDLQMNVVLAGVRPEEAPEWAQGSLAISNTVLLGASPESQLQAVEQGVEQGRRIAARGGDAVVLIDSLEAIPQQTARRILAAARNIPDGGSLTLIATAPAVIGGETTVIALDATLTGIQRFPALDLDNSGSMRPELLVGDAGADAIAKARAEALV